MTNLYMTIAFYRSILAGVFLLLVSSVMAQPNPPTNVQGGQTSCGGTTSISVVELNATNPNNNSGGTQEFRWYILTSDGFEEQVASTTSGNYTTTPRNRTTTYLVSIFDNAAGLAAEDRESIRVPVVATVLPNPIILGPIVRGLCQGSAELVAGTSDSNDPSVNPFTGLEPINYQWQSRNLSSVSNSASWIDETGPGSTSRNYTVTEEAFYRVIINYSGSCTVISPEVQVEDDITPIAQIDTDNFEFECTANGSTTLIAVTNAEPVTYQWLRDGNPISGATSINFTVNSSDVESNPGDYSVRVTAADGSCSATSEEVTISKVETPDASILDENNTDVTGQTLPFCAGEAVSFSALSATPNATYTWFEDDGLGNLTQVGTGISFTANNAGTYVLRVAVTGCATEVDVTLDGSATPVAQILDETNADAGDEIQVCRDETVTLNAISSGAGASYSWQLPAGFDPVTLEPIFSEAPNGDEQSFTTSAIVNDTRLRLVVTSGTCEVTDDIIIRVRDPFTVSIDGPASICVGQADITLNAVIGGLPVGAFTYQWQAFNGVDFVDITGAISETLLVAESSVTDENIYRVIADNGCEEISESFTVTKVNVEANINASATNLTICDDGSAATLSTPSDPAYTYQWAFSTNGTDFTEVAEAVNPSLEVTSDDLTQDNTTYRVTVSAGDCEITDDIELIRQPTPTVTIDKAPTTIFCEGGTVDLIQTDAQAGQTYQWQFSASGAEGSFTGISSETASTITGIDLEGFYRLQVTQGSCVVTSEEVFVEEVIEPTAAIIEGTTVVYCANGAQLTASPSGADLYVWERLEGSTYVEVQSGTDRAFNTNTPGVYRVTLTVTACGSASATSEPTTVIENTSGPTAAFTSGGAITFCGASTTLTAVPNSGDDVTYELLFSATEGGAFSNTAGPQQSNSFTVTNEGFYRVQVVNPDCNPPSNISDPVEVDRVDSPDPNPTNPEISEGSVTICDSEIFILTVQPDADLYEWFFSTTDSDDLADYSTAPGSSNTNEYTVTQSGFYRVRVTDSECTTATALGDKVEVEVVEGPNPNFTNPGISGGGLVNGCIGGTVTLSVEAGADSYEWFRATSSQTDISGYAIYPGDTESITIPEADAGFFRVRVTDNNCSVSEAVSGEVQVQFLEAPDPSFTNPEIVDGNLFICEGTNIPLTVAAGATTYEWFFSSTDSDDLSDFSLIPFASNAPSFTPSVSGFYKVRVTNENCTIATAVSETVNRILTIGPSATFTEAGISGGGVLNGCIGGTVTLSVASGADSYEWFRATSSQTDISGYAIYPGDTESITIPEADAGFFRVRVTDNNCTTASTISGEVEVNFLDEPDVTYTNPELAGGLITACTGENVTLEVPAGATDYEWLFSSSDSDNLADYNVAVGAANSNNYTTSIAGFYRVRVTNATCATATAVSGKVEVRLVDAPDATIANSDLNGGIISACDGQEIILTVPAGAEVYVWEFSESPSGPFIPAMGAINSNVYSATQAGFYRVVVTDDNCQTTSTTSDVVEIDLIEGPSVDIAEVQDLSDAVILFCKGSSTTLTIESVAGNTYKWQVATTIDGTYATASGTNNENTYEVTEAGFYRVAVSNESCGTAELISDPITVQAIDSPEATIEEGNLTAFCPGGDVILSVTEITGNTYQWQFSETSTGTYENITGQENSTITTNQAGFYRVVVTNTDCNVATATSEPTEVREQEEPIIRINYFESSFFCPDDSVLLTSSFATNIVGEVEYQWLFSPTPTGSFSAAEGENTNPGYFAKITGFYKLRVTNETCTITSVESDPLPVFEIGDITATIEPEPETNFCSAEGVTLFGFSGIPVANSFRWLYAETPEDEYEVIGTSQDSITVNRTGYYSVEITNTFCPNFTPIDTAVAIFVEERPLPRAEISQGDTTFFCEGSRAFISAEFNSGNTYAWEYSPTIDGNYTSIDGEGVTNSVLTTDIAGFYRVIVSNPNCPTSVNISEPIAVISTDGPPARILNPSIIDLCEGGSTTLRIDESILGNSSYRWEYSETRDGEYRTVGSNAGFVASQPGFYRVIETNNSCTTTSRQSQIIEIRQIQGPPARILQAGETLTICQGGTTTLSALAVEGADYQWQFSQTVDGTYTTIGINSISLAATQAGFYRVRVNNQECLPAANTSAPVEVQLVNGPSVNLISGTSQSFCEGGSVTLVGESSSSRDQYQWVFSTLRDGEFEPVESTNARTLSFTTTTPGFYKLRVTNPDCANSITESEVISVTEGEAPEANIIQGSLLSFCEGDVLTLTAELQNNVTYQWQFSETAEGTFTDVSQPSRSQTFQANTPGFYRVVVRRPGCGEGTISESTELRATETIRISIDSDTEALTFCESGEIMASLSVGGDFEYLWTRNGNVFSGTTNTITVNEPGTYTVTLRNPPACYSGIPAEIEVEIQDAPAIDLNLGRTVSRCGETTLAVSEEAGVTYQWFFGETPVGEETSEVSVTESGKYFIVALNEAGCAARDSINFTNLQPNVQTTVSYENCQGVIELTGGSSVTYRQGSTEDFDEITRFEGLAAGAYTFEARSATGCIRAIEIEVAETPTVALEISPDAEIALGESITLTVSGAETYQWEPAFTLSDPASSSPTATPTETTTYTVLGIDANGCTASALVTITVIEEFEVIPNKVISPNGDNQNDTWVIENIQRFPNAEVIVYDRWGLEVLRERGYDNRWDGISGGNQLPEGVYYYAIALNDGTGTTLTGTVNLFR